MTAQRGPARRGVSGRGSTSGDTRWVTLSRACEILGVNESTVRRWADSGEIACFRTPGGHRRFSEPDLHAITQSGPRGGRTLESAAVTRIRRQLKSGREDAGWYSTIEEDERDELRPLGRRLVTLVGEYLGSPADHDRIEAEVDEIGHRYGDLLARRGTPLMRAIEAFTFFRRSLDDTAKHLSKRNDLDADEAARAREQIAALADRVLLGVAASYDGSDAESNPD